MWTQGPHAHYMHDDETELFTLRGSGQIVQWHRFGGSYLRWEEFARITRDLTESGRL